MKKQNIFLISLLVLAVLPVAVFARGSNAAQSGKTVVFKIGHNAPASDPRTWAGETFSAKLSELTDGSYSGKVFPAGQLGDTKEMMEGLRLGTIDIMLDDLGTLSTYSNTAAIAFAPFLYRDAEHFFKVWNSQIGGKILDQVEKESGFYQVGLLFRDARNISATRSIQTIGDFKGLKIRVPNVKILVDGFSSLGANPTPMNFTEVFESLKNGVIDAQENPLDLIYNSSLYEVAPYIVLTNHVYGAFFFQFSSNKFRSLDKDVQQAINSAAEYTAKLYNQKITRIQKEALQKLEASDGVTVITPSPKLREQMERSSARIYENYPNIFGFVKEIRQQ